MCVQHAIFIVCITLYYFDSVQWDLWWSIHLQGRKPGFDGQSSLVYYRGSSGVARVGHSLVTKPSSPPPMGLKAA